MRKIVEEMSKNKGQILSATKRSGEQ